MGAGSLVGVRVAAGGAGVVFGLGLGFGFGRGLPGGRVAAGAGGAPPIVG
jgi:hypothetical protein